MNVGLNLFPPLVKDIDAAFIRGGNCKIHFSLSPYNSISDIAHIQITVVNQITNETVFKAGSWPLGIKFISVQNNNIPIDSNVTDDYKYYITINNEEVKGFEQNTFYKVQIRFGQSSLPDSITGNWVNDSINSFSEWSSVCLIKGISQPLISITDLISNSNINSVTLDHSLTLLTGHLSYNILGETETLKSYNIIIKKSSNNDIIIKSGEILTNQYNPNKFSYEIKQDLQQNVNYILQFNYTTISLYNQTINIPFLIQIAEPQLLNTTIEVIPDEQRGMMKISITTFPAGHSLMIQRTSSISNFLEWDNIKELPSDTNPRHLWYDTTIKSGIWYKYRIQQYRDGSSGVLITNRKSSEATEPKICVFEDIFLTCDDTQLKIQFNPNVSDLRYNVNESQQVTLGAQYPYIKRNGNNYYKSFSISGLISSLSEEMKWYDSGYNSDKNYFYDRNVAEPFTKKEELYGAATEQYESYNMENNITQYQDYIYQREFRQKVMDFLYKNNIKLFRSLTQSNILVKLTNIAFSPVTALGRMLYSFSANATQIGQYTVDNLKLYNIINKYYYIYNTLTLINETLQGEASLINKFYQELPTLERKTTDIMQLDFVYNGPENIVVYAKPKNNTIFLRYVMQNGELNIQYSDNDPIAESYFWGIYISNYTETNQYYDDITDISNPQNYYIYYIIDESVYHIDTYVKYYNEADLLATYPSEVIPRVNNATEHALLVDPAYYKMIYYNGEFYPFSENHEIMLRQLNATITYTYRTKKEG